MKGLGCSRSPEPSKLSGLAIKLKNYYLDPVPWLDSRDRLLDYFRYWKTLEFLEKEPDIPECDARFTQILAEEEANRQGLKTTREHARYDASGNVISFRLQVVISDVLYVLFGSSWSNEVCYCNSVRIDIPEKASAKELLDCLCRVNTYVEQCVATEWQEIEKRAHKLAKVAQLKKKVEEASGEREREEAKRDALFEKMLKKNGFEYKYDGSAPAVLKVTIFEDHKLVFGFGKKSGQEDLAQILDYAKRVRKLMLKYEDLCRSHRIVIDNSCDYGMMDGYGDLCMRISKRVFCFEIEDERMTEQLKEANAFVLEMMAILTLMKEKYGDQVKKPRFEREFSRWYSSRHYLSNQSRFKEEA